MKIAFLHHANVYRAGIERMLATKANLLAGQMGCEVVVLTYEQNGEPFPYPLSPKVACVDLGVHLYDAYKSAYPMRYFRKLSLRRQLAAALRRFLCEQHPDVVVCTDKDSYELKALLSVRTTERVVVEAHTGHIDHEMQAARTTSFFRWLIAKRDLRRLKTTVSQSDLLVALTPDDARCWSPYVKTVVIANCLPQYPGHAADIADEKKRVIAVGRLDYQKGFDLLLQSWRQVQDGHPDWCLDIYGDGLEKDMLNAQCSTLNLKNVSIHPSTPDIYAEYMRSDFLVCSSRWESFGMMMIEAMSCGVPVVSFDCDNGPRNIITDGDNGLLARNGDVDDLAAKIRWMMENKERRVQMGLNARKASARFGQGQIFAQYMALLSQEAGSR